METKKVGLVFLPLPQIGHMVSMVELAKNLVNNNQNYQFTITILTSPPEESSPEVSSYISSAVTDSAPNVTFHDLPGLANINVAHGVDFLKSRVKPVITDLRTSSTSIAAVVVDMFLTEMICVTDELNIPLYVYFSASASFLGFTLYLPTLEKSGLLCGKDVEEMNKEEDEFPDFHLPGFSSTFPFMALPESFFHRDGQRMSLVLKSSARCREVKGIIVNSFIELQPHSIKALEEGLYVPDGPTPFIYPVGPLLSVDSTGLSATVGNQDNDHQHECIQWLDLQPSKSVVFLCFGSRGSFSTDQSKEIAIGLERSGHRFLWVLSSPPPLGTTSGQPSEVVLDHVLPEGFMERTKDKGLVWPKFAPQTEILGHEAVGGVVTHCGWNSIMESLWFGVPMLAWPLYSEQHLNCLDMVKEMEVALGLKVDMKAGNWVAAEELERGAKCLMDDGCCDQSKKVRSNVVEISKKMRTTLKEGGSSFLSMERLASALASHVC